MKQIPTGMIEHLVTVNDTNAHGTIFGGSVMELADKAGATCARSFCGKQVLTASLDRIDFLNPIHRGEIARVIPTLLCTHKRSMQVGVRVSAISDGKMRHTADILFTFVAVDEKTMKVTDLPPWKGKVTAEVQKCILRYEERRFSKDNLPADFPKAPILLGSLPAKSPRAGTIENHHLLLPRDQNALGVLFAGRYLSWVDIVGSISARRHCGSPVVTASIEEVNFRVRVPHGATLRLVGKPIYGSSRSVLIKVTGWMWTEDYEDLKKVADAYLTFVPFDPKTGKSVQVPQIALETSEDRQNFLYGQWRYQRRKDNPR